VHEWLRAGWLSWRCVLLQTAARGDRPTGRPRNSLYAITTLKHGTYAVASVCAANTPVAAAPASHAAQRAHSNTCARMSTTTRLRSRNMLQEKECTRHRAASGSCASPRWQSAPFPPSQACPAPLHSVVQWAAAPTGQKPQPQSQALSRAHHASCLSDPIHNPPCALTEDASDAYPHVHTPHC
jgi:hypothetical protein